MKKNKLIFTSVLMLGTLLSQNAFAEDLDAIFKKVNEYVAAQNYSKALEELKWASKEIEKMNGKKIETFFPDTLAGLTGEKVQSSAVMGITNLERNYKGAGNVSVKLSLTNMGGSGSPLGGLGQMAAMFGGANGNGSETFRIQGRTATLENEDGSSPNLTVFLESGSILKFETSSGKAETLKAMAEALKLDDLDKYLKGAA